jgi:hypothetical protein
MPRQRMYWSPPQTETISWDNAENVCNIVIIDGKAYIQTWEEDHVGQREFDVDDLQVMIAKKLLTEGPTENKDVDYKKMLNEQLILAGLRRK